MGQIPSVLYLLSSYGIACLRKILTPQCPTLPQQLFRLFTSCSPSTTATISTSECQLVLLPGICFPTYPDDSLLHVPVYAPVLEIEHKALQVEGKCFSIELHAQLPAPLLGLMSSHYLRQGHPSAAGSGLYKKAG